MAAHSGASAFVGLSWQEMFDPTTPDTYQPRISEIPPLVEDLSAIAERALVTTRWGKHVRVIQDELEAMVQANDAFLREMPSYQWTLLHLARTKSWSEAVSLANTLRENHEEFEKRAVKRFSNSVEGLPQEKAAVVRCIRRIATMGLQSGRESSEFLKVVTDDLLQKSPAKVADTIVRSIRPRQAVFDCFFALKGEATAVQQIARKVGFRLVSHRDLPSSGDIAEFTAASKDMVCVAIEQQGLFPGQAVRQASRKLREAADVYNFYKNAPELSVIPVAIATEEKKKHTVVALGEQAFGHLQPRRSAVEQTKQILDVTPERLSGRVLNALEHFALAHVGAAQKVQLVNLWSAVECLVGTSKHDSAIGSICESVAPIVVWRRAEKILRYTARTLQEFRESGATGTIGDGFPKTQKNVSAECLLLTLALPDNHPHILSLLAFCGGHPLLVNRIFTLWSVFTNPKVVAAELRDSLQRTVWNLWRIYRARNLIVHEGAEVLHVPILLNHLRSYFSTVLSRTLSGMNRNPTWGVDDAIAYGKARANYLIETLEQRPECLRVCDFFAQPQRRGASPLWP
jgi:hypothetical protein